LLNFKIEPWMSQADIGAGSRWSDEIAGALEFSNFGVICVTPKNQHEPWLNFEAGAVSKLRKESRVFTYLFGIRDSEVTGPLAAFQHVSADLAGTTAIVNAINNGMPDTDRVPPRQLETQLETHWVKMETALRNIPCPSHESSPRRDVSEIVAEVLGIVREIERRPHLGESLSPTQVRSAISDLRELVQAIKREDALFKRLFSNRAFQSGPAATVSMVEPVWVGHAEPPRASGGVAVWNTPQSAMPTGSENPTVGTVPDSRGEGDEPNM
jgi:hypothetical protein